MGYFQKIVKELSITGKGQDSCRLLCISHLWGSALGSPLGSLNYGSRGSSNPSLCPPSTTSTPVWEPLGRKVPLDH